MLVERKEYKEEDGSIGYIESIFKSDNVLKSTYFPKMQRLYIAFGRGDTYSYGNVTPEMYDEFEKIDSQGKYFYKNLNKNIKYPSRKEFTLYPNEVKDLKEVVEEYKNNIEENYDEDGDE
jgi:hypothetical protein